MSGLSQQVQDLNKATLDVLHVLDTYASDILAGLSKTFASLSTGLPSVEAFLQSHFATPKGFLSSASLPTFADLEASLRRYLTASACLLIDRLLALQQADRDVAREIAEDAQAFNQREEAIAQARDGLIRLRRSLEGSYGSSFPLVLGLSGETPHEPHLLLQTFQQASESLQPASFLLPAPLDAYTPVFEKSKLAALLQSYIEPLSSTQQTYLRETKETQAARLLRQDLLVLVQRLLSSLQTWLEILARLAERRDIAERIRPAQRRPSEAVPSEA